MHQYAINGDLLDSNSTKEAICLREVAGDGDFCSVAIGGNRTTVLENISND